LAVTVAVIVFILVGCDWWPAVVLREPSVASWWSVGLALGYWPVMMKSLEGAPEGRVAPNVFATFFAFLTEDKLAETYLLLMLSC
jgi:hypothetical protein